MSMSIIEQLDDIDLADTSRGGIQARIEEVAALIRTEVEAAHSGRPAPVVPISPRSAA